MSTELRFMVIENAPDVCEGIIRRMVPFPKWNSAGYAVGVKEAIRKIETERPQLLFLDWGLNGGSAFEIMQHIRTLNQYNPYIIFNTGFQKDNPEIPQELINHYKVDKYIIKPIWENLKEHLASYLLEAEEKTKSGILNSSQIWLEDSKGKKILVDLQQLICICQHPTEPRLRIFSFLPGNREILVPLQWQKCYGLLHQHKIDYFITKNRGHLVHRSAIESYEKPFVRLREFPAKIEVVKENCRNFENWLFETPGSSI